MSLEPGRQIERQGSNEVDDGTEEVIAYYTDSVDESKRLTDGFGQLERKRTDELIVRYLPQQRSVVIDVGGASGVYSFFVARLGHETHLVDVVPKHIEEAAVRSREEGTPHLASMRVGDARALDFPDGFADLVMTHGPLYHLTERADRRQALLEARRVLRPGGALLAFAITRYAGAIYGISKGLIYDSDYMRMIRVEVETGLRTDPPDRTDTFPSAYFHRPEGLRAEVEEAGMTCEALLGVVGPAWLVPDVNAAWEDPIKRECMMEMARMLEYEPVLGPRILAVGRKPVS